MTPAGGASGSWREIIEGLSHPDVWGPGGLYPLERFRRIGYTPVESIEARVREVLDRPGAAD